MPSSRHFAPNYTHQQALAAKTWLINHGLNCRPSVSVQVQYQGQIQAMLPLAITYPDLNSVQVDFSQDFAGSAHLI